MTIIEVTIHKTNEGKHRILGERRYIRLRPEKSQMAFRGVVVSKMNLPNIATYSFKKKKKRDRGIV